MGGCEKEGEFLFEIGSEKALAEGRLDLGPGPESQLIDLIRLGPEWSGRDVEERADVLRFHGVADAGRVKIDQLVRRTRFSAGQIQSQFLSRFPSGCFLVALAEPDVAAHRGV